MYYTIGGFTLDETVLPNGKVQSAAPGGNVLYSAIGAKMWGVPVGLIAPIGNNYPNEYIELLRRNGFDLEGVNRIDHPSFYVWILHEGDGKRQIIYRLNSGSNVFLDPGIKDIPNECLNAKGALICPIRGDSQRVIANYLIEHHVPVFLDLIVIPGQIDVNLIQNKDMWGKLKSFMPSIEEVRAIFGSKPLWELLKEMEMISPKCFVIKLGHNGSLLRNPVDGCYYHIPIYPCEAIDATGAGDSYCGGFMVGLQEKNDPIEAALQGSVSASFLIEDFGAMHALKITSEMGQERLEKIRPKVRQLNKVEIEKIETLISN
jgi:ribokinase